ncbi:ATP-binding protein [Agrococcus sp. DT81.2]|uniref:ATP-binding protein n=1 Tax=Agrococcus sp. DT81.2 TaxID=3393414 RepID=UPI003CE497D7
MDGAGPPIRTPDQRLRVFVSSTLRELAEERRAVRSAIESLQLAPVMFELGSRPHPPRSLYRAYMAQSDVFVGIYGERYGWVAPGESASGLEDEYALSGELPSLIYVKDPAPDREPRLEALLDRIRADDRTSYRSYRDAGELAELVRQDLATLLAERFDAGRARAGGPIAPGIPAPYSAIVGRDAERDALLALLARPDVRIVTIVGDGGIGKSRLAIEVAGAAAAAGGGVAFAMLETITVPERVITVIARSLGVRDTGDAPLEEKVIDAVAGRDVLLVVDNVEHVLGAVGLLVRLISAAPRLTLLVTSRSPLRVRAERLFPLGPLGLPAPGAGPEAIAAAPAVALFAERAAAVHPGFQLGLDNAATVTEICRRLDGSPLAIELAAARMLWMPVDELLRRLESALTLLVGGARDLPERQQALRSTIQWSVDLLPPGAAAALTALAVPSGPFLGATAEDVLGAAGIGDPVAALTALAEASLLRSEDRRGTPLLSLASLVRAFAREARPELLDTARSAWIDHYRRVAAAAAQPLRGGEQLATLQRLELEAENLGTVVRLLLDDGRLDDAAEYVWSLHLYLWIGGHLGLVREWMTELLEIADRESIPLAVRTRAIALYHTHTVRFWQEPTADVVPGMQAARDLFAEAGDRGGAALADVSIGLGLLTRPEGPDVAGAMVVLERSRAGFREAGDAWGEAAISLVMLGRIALVTGALEEARGRFEASLELASAQHELLGVAIARNHRGWARLLSGDVAGAADDFGTSLDESIALGHDDGVAYGLEGFVGVRAAEGDADAAGLLQGAAQSLRRRTGLLNRSGLDFATPLVQRLRDAGAGDALDAAAERGAAMPLAEVLELVHAP